ncbi:MAG: cytochrome C oxidase Cbb3 [Deltaproteobacteria bacterium]|nr:MAG: cytochrome C oxidase Cbb3 [Deltaproteobacteria bacterium]
MNAKSDQDLLLDHNYDGIQEYDNPLPGWWSGLFVGTIVFSVLYLLYHHSGVEGRSIYDEYEREAAEVFEKRFAELGELSPDKETILKYANDPKWLAVGEAVFKANCVSCHGDGGLGNVGPNLTDDYWKNVESVEDIAKVIANGAAGGAMPAWKNRLSHPNQIVLTAAYVASLRGKGGGGGKPPEGREIPPW